MLEFYDENDFFYLGMVFADMIYDKATEVYKIKNKVAYSMALNYYNKLVTNLHDDEKSGELTSTTKDLLVMAPRFFTQEDFQDLEDTYDEVMKEIN
jgi:hypothetical protein